MAKDVGFFGGIADALGIIRRELPRWWVDANRGRYMRPSQSLMGPPELSNEDITPADVAEFALEMSPLGLLTTSEDAEGKIKGKGKGGGKVKKAIGTIWDAITDPDQALALAKRGYHIKRMPDGTYVGAPAQVTSPQSLATVRANADRLVDEGLFNAAWYERARNAYREAAPNSPVMQSLFSRGGAAYSPQATPPIETGAFLSQHNNKVVLGNDVVPRTGAQARNVARAYSTDPSTGAVNFDPRAIRTGPKTGAYADAKDPTVPESSQYRTANDIWHARVMGYEGPPGKSGLPTAFNRGLTPQEHGWLTGENLLLAERASQRNAGSPEVAGLLGGVLNPRSAQAATWGSKRLETRKAEDLFRWQQEFDDFARGVTNKEPSPPLSDKELKKYASIGIDDAIRQHYSHLTRESINDPILEAMPWKEKLAYTRAAFGDGRDPTIEALGMYQMNPREAVGKWLDEAGVMHTNPMVDAHPLVSYDRTRFVSPAKEGPQYGKKKDAWNWPKSGQERVTTGGAYVDPASIYALDFASYLDAVMRGQGAGAASAFIPANQSMKAVEKTGGKIVAPPNVRSALKSELDNAGLLSVDTGDALMVGQYADTPLEQMFLRTYRRDNPSTKRAFGFPTGTDVQQEAGRVLNDAAERGMMFQYTPGRLQTVYNPIDWSGPDGTVTRGLLDRIRTSPIANLEKRLDNSRWTGEGGVAAALNRLDTLMNSAENVPLKPKLMRLRELIAEKKFSGLRQFVEENGTAGLPAVGIAFPGIFDDERQPGLLGR